MRVELPPDLIERLFAGPNEPAPAIAFSETTGTTKTAKYLSNNPHAKRFLAAALQELSIAAATFEGDQYRSTADTSFSNINFEIKRAGDAQSLSILLGAFTGHLVELVDADGSTVEADEVWRRWMKRLGCEIPPPPPPAPDPVIPPPPEPLPVADHTQHNDETSSDGAHQPTESGHPERRPKIKTFAAPAHDLSSFSNRPTAPHKPTLVLRGMPPGDSWNGLTTHPDNIKAILERIWPLKSADGLITARDFHAALDAVAWDSGRQPMNNVARGRISATLIKMGLLSVYEHNSFLVEDVATAIMEPSSISQIAPPVAVEAPVAPPEDPTPVEPEVSLPPPPAVEPPPPVNLPPTIVVPPPAETAAPPLTAAPAGQIYADPLVNELYLAYQRHEQAKLEIATAESLVTSLRAEQTRLDEEIRAAQAEQLAAQKDVAETTTNVDLLKQLYTPATGAPAVSKPV